MDNREIELQALITEREGMIADNKESNGDFFMYSGAEFRLLAAKIRSLKDEK